MTSISFEKMQESRKNDIFSKKMVGSSENGISSKEIQKAMMRHQMVTRSGYFAKYTPPPSDIFWERLFLAY